MLRVKWDAMQVNRELPRKIGSLTYIGLRIESNRVAAVRSRDSCQGILLLLRDSLPAVVLKSRCHKLFDQLFYPLTAFDKLVTEPLKVEM